MLQTQILPCFKLWRSIRWLQIVTNAAYNVFQMLRLRFSLYCFTAFNGISKILITNLHLAGMKLFLVIYPQCVYQKPKTWRQAAFYRNHHDVVDKNTLYVK